MGRPRARAGVMAVSVLVGTFGILRVSGQAISPQRSQPTDPSRPLGADPNRADDPFSGRLAEQAARSRNSDRQKKLVADTEKLLSLATELKQQVDKTDKNTLSVDVVKKADEIEKLAHSVKEKMKGGV